MPPAAPSAAVLADPFTGAAAGFAGVGACVRVGVAELPDDGADVISIRWVSPHLFTVP